jgi:hypothetical protein
VVVALEDKSAKGQVTGVDSAAYTTVDIRPVAGEVWVFRGLYWRSFFEGFVAGIHEHFLYLMSEVDGVIRQIETLKSYTSASSERYYEAHIWSEGTDGPRTLTNNFWLRVQMRFTVSGYATTRQWSYSAQRIV